MAFLNTGANHHPPVTATTTLPPLMIRSNGVKWGRIGLSLGSHHPDKPLRFPNGWWRDELGKLGEKGKRTPVFRNAFSSYYDNFTRPQRQPAERGRDIEGHQWEPQQPPLCLLRTATPSLTPSLPRVNSRLRLGCPYCLAAFTPTTAPPNPTPH
ncbi:hypothetical protein E2C01_061771 [Portunus trituberculatus]|uniref:Uncharacterized protein n=1 Tax=Portunus trituberculatus TaxID=210409 RepID=A0A5B7HG85_PORTR|nr:hypothetical protein [Portunus trituberculatus]